MPLSIWTQLKSASYAIIAHGIYSWYRSMSKKSDNCGYWDFRDLNQIFIPTVQHKQITFWCRGLSKYRRDPRKSKSTSSDYVLSIELFLEAEICTAELRLLFCTDIFIFKGVIVNWKQLYLARLVLVHFGSWKVVAPFSPFNRKWELSIL